MKDGMNSNCIYNIAIDDYGRYWLASPGGLMMYDGYNFKPYGSSQGFKNKDIVRVEYHNNYLYTFSTEYFEIIPISEVNKLVNNKLYKEDLGKVITYEYRNNKFYILNRDSVCSFERTKKLETQILKRPFWNDKINSYQDILKYNEKKEIDLIEYSRKVGNLKNSKYYPEEYYSLFNLGKVMLYSLDSNFKIVKKNILCKENNSFYLVYYISDNLFLIKDNNLFYIFDYKKKNYKYLFTCQSNSIELTKDILFICTPKNGLQMEQPINLKKQSYPEFKYNEISNYNIIKSEVTKNLYNYKYRIWINKLGFNEILQLNKKLNYTSIFKNTTSSNLLITGIKSFADFKDSILLIGFRKNVGTLIYNSYTKKIIDSLDPSWVKKLRVDNKKNIYILTYEDFRIIKNYQKGNYTKRNYKLFYKGNFVLVNDILHINNKYYFATNDQGVFISDSNFKFYSHISEQDGLQSNLISQVKIDKYDRLWLQTERGIDRVSKDLKVSNIVQYSEFDNFDIKDFTVSDDSLWVFSENSVYSLNYKDRFKAETIPIVLNEINVDDTSSYYMNDSNISIGPNWNIIKLNYAGIYLKEQENVMYRYRIIQNEDTGTWQITNQHILPLSALQNGKYTIQIQAYHNIYPSRHSQVLNVNFKIKPFFYQTWWFYTLVFLSLLSVIIGFIWYRNKLKLEKLKAESELNRLTLHGLQNQMNPHFVFNALNTLQHFIVKKDNMNSLNFLSDFSNLIRKILDNSRSELISLEEEIEFLRQYTIVEAERYSHKFMTEFKIEFDEDELSDIKIPPMLVQPLIENAIKHGVSNLESQGKIEIIFSIIDNDILQVSVIDNGKGIVQKDKSNSKATIILHERLNLIKHKNINGSFELKRIDNLTHAIIRIPI